VVWQVICAVVHASWHDVPEEGIGVVALPGTTQVVWQLDATELQPIMQVVTAEVTVVVSGVIAVGVCCANATPAGTIPDESAAATSNKIAARRIIASQVASSHVKSSVGSPVTPFATNEGPL